MATKNTLFTVAGITLHSRDEVSVNKVRFGTDQVRMIKMLSSSRKIGVSYNFGGREDGYLDPKRVDVVELPRPMTKVEAIKFLLSHPTFQSPEDQCLLQEQISSRSPKAPRVRAAKTVKVKPGELSLDSIKARDRLTAVTVSDVLDAVAE